MRRIDRVCVCVHWRTDREKGRTSWGRTGEYGLKKKKKKDFPKSCARIEWDLLVGSTSGEMER